ncbi:endonuclease III [SCandidatus Aminicenantes bacterium Aminicenantia_JdfR_composite]|nr:endonuclease III [SCandidatus Aminicenantes bacterium Aminicenantia_JdfR_composite]MCP2597749.1 endonuclease III [Candidatus Aminicenantes bacterium AC-335-L06]
MNKNSLPRKVESIIAILKSHYKPFEFSSRDPFKVLITTILSQRTRDENTALASKRFFEVVRSPEDVLKLDPKIIEETIKPSGFYKVKAKRIIEISKQLVNNYGSKVPFKKEELLKFKGVGRKTANAVSAFAFNKPAIVVDTHVHRISNRLGLINSKNPEQTEYELSKIVPKKYWILINKLFVIHGQKICRPINPKCSECKITNFCDKKI